LACERGIIDSIYLADNLSRFVSHDYEREHQLAEKKSKRVRLASLIIRRLANAGFLKIISTNRERTLGELYKAHPLVNELHLIPSDYNSEFKSFDTIRGFHGFLRGLTTGKRGDRRLRTKKTSSLDNILKKVQGLRFNSKVIFPTKA